MINYVYPLMGIAQSAGAFLSYFVIFADHGFYPSQLRGVREKWDSPYVDDAQDSLGQHWTYKQRMELQLTVHTYFFVAIVVAQWANLVVCKTRRLSVFAHGLKNDFLTFSLFFETALAALLAFVPFCNTVFLTRPGLFYWHFPALPIAVWLLLFDETRKYVARGWPGCPIDKLTNY